MAKFHVVAVSQKQVTAHIPVDFLFLRLKEWFRVQLSDCASNNELSSWNMSDLHGQVSHAAEIEAKKLFELLKYQPGDTIEVKFDIKRTLSESSS